MNQWNRRLAGLNSALSLIALGLYALNAPTTVNAAGATASGAAGGASAAAPAMSPKWVAGKNYRVLNPAQPTQVAPGKVEVLEVFWYGCNHCYALEPFLNTWLKSKSANIEFVRVPVTWGVAHQAHARFFYTLDALGKLPALHAKVFDEIHVRQKFLTSNDAAEAARAQQAFATANGVSAADFTKTYRSFGVESKLKQAQDIAKRYQVDAVPLVIINGKYITDVGMAGGQNQLLQLINDLAAGEKRR